MRGRPFINKVEQNYFLVEESKYLTNFPLQNYWAALLPANLYIIFLDGFKLSLVFDPVVWFIYMK